MTLSLDRSHDSHAARADALAKLGRPDEARNALERSIERAQKESERAEPIRRLNALH